MCSTDLVVQKTLLRLKKLYLLSLFVYRSLLAESPLDIVFILLETLHNEYTCILQTLFPYGPMWLFKPRY